jgi:hypothetical protein
LRQRSNSKAAGLYMPARSCESFLMNHRSRPSRRRADAIARVVVCVGLLLAGEAWAEGAVRTLSCSVVRDCDAAGTCADGAGEVVFRMEPTDVSEDGSGSYRLSYNDTTVAMTALSAAGPFVWSAGEARHTLLASSEREFLWHRLTLRPVPDSLIRFLVCRFAQ